MVLSQNEKFGCFITKSLSETSEKVYDEVYEMAFNRERAIHAHLENDFSCQKAYTLSISVDAPGSCVRLENMRLAYGDHYTGTYFAECGVTLHPEIGPDQEFDHWLVNDVVYDTQTLYLDALRTLGRPRLWRSYWSQRLVVPGSWSSTRFIPRGLRIGLNCGM